VPGSGEQGVEGAADGGRPSAAELLGAALQVRVDRVLGWDPHLRAQTPGAVVAMRLATRELRSLLAGLAPVLPRSQVAPVRPGLRRLGGLLGEVRSAELLHERIIAAIAGLPPDLIVGPVTRRADTEFSARTREALNALHIELDSEAYLELAAGLEQLARDPRFSGRAGQPAEAVLAGLAREHLRKLESAVEAFSVDVALQAEGAPGTPVRNTRLGWVLRAHEVAALQAIGKTVKRARFVTELAVPVAGPAAETTAQALVFLQNLVSSQRDGAVMRTALRELGGQSTVVGQSAFTFGLLHGLELAGDATQLDDVIAAWRAARRAARTWPG
jgi:CHAD domain-containing protein